MEREYAQRYGELEQWHWWFQGRTRIVESVLRRRLRPFPARDILSVGCGPAKGLEWILPFAGAKGTVTGLDMEPSHATPCPEGIGFVVGHMEDPPLRDRRFDVVLALDVLEHLDDDTAGLQQAVRLLKPGGFLTITVPAFPFLWGGQDVVSEHRRRYTKQTLTALLKRGGLQDFNVTYFNTFLFPAAAAVRTIRRLRGHANRSRSDFEGSRPGPLNTALSHVFGAERHLVDRVWMPAGVSLLATYQDAGEASPGHQG
jgi:SAM-dependent methyltransferase